MAAKKTVLFTIHNLVDGGGSSSTDFPTATYQTVVNNWHTKGYKVKSLSQVFAAGVA
jgi:hypothetical protein